VEHAIGVRVVGGNGEFFIRKTGEKFVPRGATYLRRGTVVLTDGSSSFRENTFVVGVYDATRAENALTQMQTRGYNTVKILIDQGCQDGCSGSRGTRDGLNAAYIANVVDFLKRAKTRDLYVDIAAENVPANSRYDADLHSADPNVFGGRNGVFLSQEGVRASASFWEALVRALKTRGAPLDTIRAFEIAEEAWYQAQYPPLSLSSGKVTTANGMSYDMASGEDTLRMLDDGFVYYADTVRAAIKAVDPTALVGMGFFPPQRPNRWLNDGRFLLTGGVIQRSTLDWLDLHHYPGIPSLTFEQAMQNFGLPPGTPKPVVMGEYGAFKFAFPTSQQAVQGLADWDRKSCAYGYDGWLLWTWDTDEGLPGEPPLWNAMTDGGAVAQGMSPKSRPDPCA
jgi:hypothetical protein